MDTQRAAKGSSVLPRLKQPTLPVLVRLAAPLDGAPSAVLEGDTGAALSQSPCARALCVWLEVVATGSHFIARDMIAVARSGEAGSAGTWKQAQKLWKHAHGAPVC